MAVEGYKIRCLSAAGRWSEMGRIYGKGNGVKDTINHRSEPLTDEEAEKWDEALLVIQNNRIRRFQVTAESARHWALLTLANAFTSVEASWSEKPWWMR